MSTGQGFVLHPQAAQDITDIWEFLAEENPQAARRVREDILPSVRWCLFPIKAIGGLTSPHALYDSSRYVST